MDTQTTIMVMRIKMGWIKEIFRWQNKQCFSDQFEEGCE